MIFVSLLGVGAQKIKKGILSKQFADELRYIKARGHAENKCNFAFLCMFVIVRRSVIRRKKARRKNSVIFVSIALEQLPFLIIVMALLIFYFCLLTRKNRELPKQLRQFFQDKNILFTRSKKRSTNPNAFPNFNQNILCKCVIMCFSF